MTDEPSTDTLASRFSALGLNENAIKEAIRNKKIAATWTAVLDEAKIDGNTKIDDSKIGTVLSALVTAAAKDGALGAKREYIVKAIRDGRIKSNVQVDSAVKYAKSLPGGIEDDSAFDKACGVGM
jgi:glutaminyl-tRNA synthetase